MSLTLWKKREPAVINGGLSRLRDEMDRTFDRFFGDPWTNFGMFEPKLLRTEAWFPAMDVSENEQEVTIRAEIPGISAKDLDISVSGNTLTIAGVKKEEREEKKENYYQCECRYGEFRRVIDLPETIDSEKVTAESDSGVVTIRVAKKAGTKTRKVEVKPTARKVAVTG